MPAPENTFRKLQVCPCGAGIACPLARLPLAKSGGMGERTRKITYAWAASRRVLHRLLHAPPPSAPVIDPLRESNPQSRYNKKRNNQQPKNCRTCPSTLRLFSGVTRDRRTLEGRSAGLSADFIYPTVKDTARDCKRKIENTTASLMCRLRIHMPFLVQCWTVVLSTRNLTRVPCASGGSARTPSARAQASRTLI